MSAFTGFQAGVPRIPNPSETPTMRTTAKLLLCGGLMALTAFAFAQPGRPATSDLATKMMAFDANKDG